MPTLPYNRRSVALVTTLALASAAALIVGAAPDDKKKADIVEVNIKNLSFIPDPVTVKVGQTVRWTNNDDRDCQLMGRTDDTLRSPNIRPKEKWEFKFTKPGKVEYFDMLHPRVQGTVEVQEK